MLDRQVESLKACTLQVYQGETFGLLGLNGAGKTTLLRLLLGYLWPTAGWAKIAGLDCQQQSLAVRQQVAYLPAEAAIFPQMRGRLRRSRATPRPAPSASSCRSTPGAS